MRDFSSISGVVFDIQRSALKDGPGLRTTVFLKGCPLRCLWCHNPESWNLQPHADALGRIVGRQMTVEDVMQVVRLDRDYYAMSGGGLTVSGGEPLFQADFTGSLLEAAHAEGIHTCLDSSGYAPKATLAALFPHVDVFHFDYKATGDALHQRLTGVPGRRIRENLKWLLDSGARVILRCPLVPGVNDTDRHLRAIREWAESYPRQIVQVDLLPYHATGVHKCANGDTAAPSDAFEVPSSERIQAWLDRLPMAQLG